MEKITLWKFLLNWNLYPWEYFLEYLRQSEYFWNICVKMKSVWGRILAGTSRGWDRDQCARLWGGGGGKPWSAADAATTTASSHRSQLCCSVGGGAVVPWRPGCRATWASWWWPARPGTLLPSTIIGRLMGNALPCGGGSSSRSSSPRGGLLRCSQQTTWQPDSLTTWQPGILTTWQLDNLTVQGASESYWGWAIASLAVCLLSKWSQEVKKWQQLKQPWPPRVTVARGLLANQLQVNILRVDMSQDITLDYFRHWSCWLINHVCH